MSSQDAPGVSFSILPEDQKQHFRLIELPPELLELLASDDAPALKFKSPGTAFPKTFGAETVLCTNDRTYSIRQVNTSNSVYICQSRTKDGDSDLDLPQSALEAIADSDFTLELNASKPNPTIAKTSLRALLPEYSATDTIEKSKDPISKRQLFEDLPYSDAECEAFWTEHACFELADGSGCVIPHAGAKLNAWQGILQQATADDVSLVAPITMAKADLLHDPDAEFPIELTRAVLRSMSTANDEIAVLDRERCAKQVASIALNCADAKGMTLSISDFIKEWQNLLPEAWRDQAKVDLLPEKDFVRTSDVIRCAGEGDTPKTTEAAKTQGAKRKWHEQFRASKKGVSKKAT